LPRLLFAIAPVAWHYDFTDTALSGYPAPDAFTGDYKYRSSKPEDLGKNNKIRREKRERRI
jgi:hypothetical protein